MKALTLTQPWATLVALDEKRIESRSWNTNYRGPVAIHAALGFPKWARNLCYTEPFARVLRAAGYTSADSLPLGKVLCIAEIITTKQVDSADWRAGQDGWSKGHHFWEASRQEYEFGDYRVGRHMWFLRTVAWLPTPVAARGALGLWEWIAEPCPDCDGSGVDENLDYETFPCETCRGTGLVQPAPAQAEGTLTQSPTA